MVRELSGHFIEGCKVLQVRQLAAYPVFELPELVGIDAGSKKIDLHRNLGRIGLWRAGRGSSQLGSSYRIPISAPRRNCWDCGALDARSQISNFSKAGYP